VTSESRVPTAAKKRIMLLSAFGDRKGAASIFGSLNSMPAPQSNQRTKVGRADGPTGHREERQPSLFKCYSSTGFRVKSGQNDENPRTRHIVVDDNQAVKGSSTGWSVLGALPFSFSIWRAW
jgi:hypothetical protein